jgi:iron only hydrogenase large subunit-like protein
MEEANVAYIENGETKVRVDNDKCIACGACLHACNHDSRSYEDDTERFFLDLRNGTPISLFCAPASRASLTEWSRILALLGNMGVRKMYDVSLGADICTWGHIRYIQKNNPRSLISQPCPAIVNYVLMHRNELLPYLSPVQSPMMCVAIYMRNYQGVTDKIAAISPCIAKTNEFEESGGLVSYNITFKRLEEYIKRNNLKLPAQGRGYDHIDSSLGSIYSMPGGLKENVDFMLGKALRIDKSEGQKVVYKDLDTFRKEDPANLPAVFDVLNCAEGCNLGTGCRHDKTLFELNAAMEKARQNAVKGRDREYFEQLYQEYDKTLRLNDFMRNYRPVPVRSIKIDNNAIEEAFVQLGKHDDENRTFDCGACGSDTCLEMAQKIAKKINTHENCIKRAHDIMKAEHATIVTWQKNNTEAINTISADIDEIKVMTDKIVSTVTDVDKLINLYDMVTKDIDKIASNVHMISINASIEAARAGDQGRSFAVVAEAIRSLAGETQKATAKISNATGEAKSALGAISKMVTTIGEDVTKANSDVREIAGRTNDLLKNN